MSIKLSFNGGEKFVLDSTTPSPPVVPRGEASGVVVPITDTLQESFAKIMQEYNEFSDKVIGGQIEFILKPVGIFLRDCFFSLIHLLNSNSVEIITLGILMSAIGCMLSPLWNASSGVWLGRTLAISMLGSVWRLVI